MTMTRKNFESIATILGNDPNPSLVASFADYFATENPNFDREKFIEAVGGPIRGPKNDQEGVEWTYDALVKAGYTVHTRDCDTYENIKGSRTLVIDEALAADEGFLFVSKDGVNCGWVYFVYGNEPYEVINDYTVNLEHVIGPLTKNWS